MGTVTGFAYKLLKNAEKKRIKGSSSVGEPLTSEEFAVCCFNAGLTVSEIDEWNIGTILDFIHAKNVSMMKSKDKNYHTDEERYKQLKAVEPLVDKRYKNGLISKEKYERFKKTLGEWE